MQPFVRTAMLTGHPRLCRSLDVDPGPLLARVGLDPADLDVPDRWIPAHAAVRLLEISAAACGRQDFGLLMVSMRRLSTLGPVSLVVRDAPDLRTAVRTLISHQAMYNEALDSRLSEQDGLATITAGLEVEGAELRQSSELVLGVWADILRSRLGEGWRPLRASFTHSAPEDPTAQQAFFDSVVEFGCRSNSITMYADDLDIPIPGADPQLLLYASEYVESVRSRPRPVTTVDRVRALITVLLPTGSCSAEQVARSLGVDRRTLHRRLAASGNTFTELLNETRGRLASRLVSSPAQPLAEIPSLLGFSSPGAFSRWFREHFGCSPRTWRHRPGGPPDRAPSG
ncbi:AraC family transcriptional regulator [Streptomyces tropicalis]|uniref:AraC family transcriptional regulator n=1 Tax=Streptomyces tropicalis TaxID=3034234 RepID=A0ABT6A9D0_9ACTN|nr:AraC family transcriptional regulator [Streptomyces tropicalis]MDF3300440.1 AraC family transcriptional regulator [Streptomyces tropicalis]